jgi:hypothetical protein
MRSRSRKLPRSRAEILDIEDRLDQIRQNFKNLRREMQESGEEYVELCLGHVLSLPGEAGAAIGEGLWGVWSPTYR